MNEIPADVRAALQGLVAEWERRCALPKIYDGGTHITGLGQAAAELERLLAETDSVGDAQRKALGQDPVFLERLAEAKRFYDERGIGVTDYKTAVETLAGKLPKLFIAEGVVYWFFAPLSGQPEDTRAWKLLHGDQDEVLREAADLEEIAKAQ